ncbi:YchJ family protein [Flectobacillus sp. DC10W]|uniref:UPF0225 protein QM480_05760 n=1 Tax=Flectobacillus longus TaxID=2984207 RepID=A0ABT6YKZ1_9BACT|nr:YchJ family protein [Flectobacillus longus]MDI9863818.1 YchJ family protein [Flectobacillus longus]
MSLAELCPCGSQKAYTECCEPFIEGKEFAPTAEQLMRSRYTAYSKIKVDYLVKTTHPSRRSDFEPSSIREWATENNWIKLEVLSTKNGKSTDTQGEVEFRASFKDADGIARTHYEYSSFVKEQNRWYYVSGKFQPPANQKIDRNAPCPCGSGKKYKKCCGK